MGHANQGFVALADRLHLHVAKAEFAEVFAQRADVELTSLRLNLDQRAALEVDAVVQASSQQQTAGYQCQYPGKPDEPEALADHVPLGAVREKIYTLEHVVTASLA